MEEHTPMNGNSQPDTGNEIDLLTLFITCCKGIGRGIAATVKGIGIALTACFSFCVRHFFWLLGGVASGLLIIIIISTSQLAKKSYMTGEAMLSCYGTALADIESEIGKLNKIIQADKNASQALLCLTQEQVRSIKSITFGYGMDIDNDTVCDFVEYNSLKARNIYTEKTLKGGPNGDKIVKIPLQQKVPNIFFLKIEMKIDNVQNFREIGYAVCNYLNNLPAMQQQLALRRLDWENRITEIDRQKTLLDSMLRIEYFENSRLKAASYGNGSDRLTLADPKAIGIPFDYKDILALVGQKNDLLNLLTHSQQMVNIVSDFQPTLTSMRTRKLGIGLIWMGLFFISALIYDYRKPIGQYIREQRQK